jgi:Tfp pilus assembly protein PilV
MGRDRQGMNVIEVLLASAIFAVMLVPMMGLFQLGNRFSLAGERELVATLFAQDMLEQLRAEMDRWSQGATREVGLPRIPLQPPKGYRYRIEHKRIERGLEEYTVEVSWKMGKRKQTVHLSTLLSRAPCISHIRKKRNLFRRSRGSRRGW